MSKLYIKDLERIKNGNLVNFNYQESNYFSKKITLAKLNEQIKDLRHIRYYILDMFKKDIEEKLDRVKGLRIEKAKEVNFNYRNPFSSKYLFLNVATMFGDTSCLVSENKIESASFKTSELEEIISYIFPYIKGIFNVRNNTNVLNNEFYNSLKLYNDKNNVLNINGDGILLPFDDYKISEEDLQELLKYYYINYNSIIKNIFIPDDNHLDKFRTNASKQKVLHLYNEGKQSK